MHEVGENLDNEQLNRLMQHAMHSQNRFDNRLNFFLIFESVLLGVATTLYSKSTSTDPVLITIICLGFFLTVLWGYVQAREKFLFDVAQKHLTEVVPEYREIIRREHQAKWPLGSTSLLTYGVPWLMTGVWIVLFILAAKPH
jgi:hypothetical protein